jgi:pimeloyl-ACP methyl ester carboxylesterase
VLLAASEPERFAGLVLIGTSLRFPEPNAPDLPHGVTPESIMQFTAELDNAVAHWGEGLLVRLIAPSIDTPLQRRFWARFERASATPSMVKGLLALGRRIDIREIARTVDLPALVIHMSEDRIPVQWGREAAELLPSARFVEFPGHDHAFWFAENDGIVDEIEQFLTGARSALRPTRVLTSVLFTDIVGSTAKAAELGDEACRG